ncbi:alcohol dehydrogenase catalytic domain-containing protein [Ornithinimicrobium sp. Y1694]|uniref:alcohol dehydrogenase catalytic domain-containing protein n=1 Tax=Ornithinimicrobium sp. Y1694 TaxID=3418590 RepID=UPI003CEE5470
MRAVRFDAFGQPPYLAEVPVPEPPHGGVVIKVGATGLCRSDWHGWQGHDPDIVTMPHTPGHEFAGTVHAVGEGVERVRVGERVVVPFVCGCGDCGVCRTGSAHVCPHQWQPGFSGPGSFAEYVAVPAADFNVVELPAEVSFDVAAGLGCRFATAYRGIVDVGAVRPGDTVAVFGCGGVGLAAVMVAESRGAHVIAVDVSQGALTLAREVGAAATINSAEVDPVEAIRTDFPDGVNVSVDALGSVTTADAAVRSLRVHGRHVQIGLLAPVSIGDRATVPMHVVIARELQVLGSHGMPAVAYPDLLSDIATGRLDPGRFLARAITLEETPAALAAMGGPGAPAGITVIRP